MTKQEIKEIIDTPNGYANFDDAVNMAIAMYNKGVLDASNSVKTERYAIDEKRNGWRINKDSILNLEIL